MVATWIFAGLSVGCLAAFAYPYLIYPQVLRMLRPRPLAKADVARSVSLLFSAYNEDASLPAKLANLRRLKARAPDLEILVYDDCSSDGTGALLAAAGDILTVIPGPGRTGKAAGMKRLAAAATGDILVFTDANVLLAEDLIDRLLPYYGDPEVGGVAGTIQTLARKDSVISDIGSSYVAWDDRLQLAESRTGNVMGASGGLFSVRRALYPDFPSTVQDDFAVSMGVVFQGMRLVKAPDVLAFEDSVAERPDELRRRTRIGARALHTHRHMRPGLVRMSRLDRFKYGSRKMMRWMGGLFLVLSFLFALLAAATISLALAGAMLAMVLALLGASVLVRGGLLSRLGALVLSTFATFYGAALGLSGRTMPTWNPAKSR